MVAGSSNSQSQPQITVKPEFSNSFPDPIPGRTPPGLRIALDWDQSPSDQDFNVFSGGPNCPVCRMAFEGHYQRIRMAAEGPYHSNVAFARAITAAKKTSSFKVETLNRLSCRRR